MRLRSTLLTATGALVVVVAVYIALSRPMIAAAVTAAIAYVLIVIRLRESPGRLALLLVVSLIAVPLVPGLQETRTPQLAALAGVSLPVLVAALAYLRQTRSGLRLPLVATLVPVGLTIMSTGIISFNEFRLTAGLTIGIGLGASTALGRSFTQRDIRTLIGGLTIMTSITSVIAVIEVINQSPLYAFTAFQLPSNAQSLFRASAVYGHPLALCAASAFVALINLARPPFHGRWYTSRLVTVGMPAAGALASGSRTLIILVAVGVLAILFARQDRTVTRSKGFTSLAVLAAVGGLIYSIVSGGVIGDRLSTLSLSEQSIRLNAWNVATSITNGPAILIGNGPRSVAEAFRDQINGVTFGTLDNQFLTAYTDFGLIGAVLVLAAALTLLGSVRRRRISDWHRALATGSLVLLAAFLAFDVIAWPTLAALFGVGLGAAVSRNDEDGLAIPKDGEAVQVHSSV